MDATPHLPKEAGARLDIEEIEIGEEVCRSGKDGGHAGNVPGVAERD